MGVLWFIRLMQLCCEAARHVQVCVQVALCRKPLQHQCNTVLSANKWHNHVYLSHCAASDDRRASGDERGLDGACEEEVSEWQCCENEV